MMLISMTDADNVQSYNMPRDRVKKARLFDLPHLFKVAT